LPSCTGGFILCFLSVLFHCASNVSALQPTFEAPAREVNQIPLITSQPEEESTKFQKTYPVTASESPTPSDEPAGFCKTEKTTCPALEDTKHGRQCRCDVQCRHFGDCCVDVAEGGASLYRCRSLQSMIVVHRVQRGFKWGFNWFIEPVRISDEGVLMVARCPPQEDPGLDRLCRRQVPPSEYSYLLDYPVTSNATNVTYANVYCARCNADHRHLVRRNADLKCSEHQALKKNSPAAVAAGTFYQQGALQWWTEDADAFCYLDIPDFGSVKKFAEQHHARTCVAPELELECQDGSHVGIQCLRRQIHDCAKGWPNDENRSKCGSYIMLVEANGTVYKNPHCALCNNADTHALTCYTDKEMMTGINLPPAFSVLMDFSSRDCNDYEVFDPLSGACHLVVVDQQNNSTVSHCPKIKLKKDEFHITKNGSLVENLTGIVHIEGTFVLEESDAFVCSERLTYLQTVKRSQRILTLILLIISIICLLLHITLYILLPKLQNLPSRNLFSLSCSLFTSQKKLSMQNFKAIGS